MTGDELRAAELRERRDVVFLVGALMTIPTIAALGPLFAWWVGLAETR